jgi:ribosomal protein S18 acetylase RimI-like enzyme
MIDDDFARGTLFVLVADGICQATVALDAYEPAEYKQVVWTADAPALVVHRLCVDPQWQGLGLAKRMMEFAEVCAVEHRYASIRLDAYTANPAAVCLYRDRGYREAGSVFFPRRSLPSVCFERAVNERINRPPNEHWSK